MVSQPIFEYLVDDFTDPVVDGVAIAGEELVDIVFAGSCRLAGNGQLLLCHTSTVPLEFVGVGHANPPARRRVIPTPHLSDLLADLLASARLRSCRRNSVRQGTPRPALTERESGDELTGNTAQYVHDGDGDGDGDGAGTPTPDLTVPRSPLRALTSSALWRVCAHLALDGVMATAGLVVLTVLGTGLCAVPFGLVGLPVSVAAGWALYRLAALERLRFAVTSGVRISEPPQPPCSWRSFQSMVALARSRCTWRLITYFTLLTGVSMVTTVGVALVWAVPLMLVLLPAYYRFLPRGQVGVGPWILAGLPSMLLIAALALLFGAFVSPLLVRPLMALDLFLGRTLLSRPPGMELMERVKDLTESRARVVDAAEAERRRIERDLHDGAQQRLVAMSMTLGRASSRLKKSGDEMTGKLVEDVRRETLYTITELRNLARGLHPPVLTDRGLEAALSAVIALAPVPVRLDVEAEPRPSATVEAVAYFTVSEALTNVAKHARASRAWVNIRREGDLLTMTIGDDGQGGADPARGSGLSGLEGRISAVDGRLRIDSPVGGPTVIEVEIPCG
ncbi:sensor histidine kinase [Streptomyces sp. NPDC001401]|uniref:sensor histidine kinase n=1 Tax=Streptomyces sp. NPDC001401 TaxID=3364570 RepID=UPI0036C4FACB